MPSDYLITNFHNLKCNHLEKKIKKAVFPVNIFDGQFDLDTHMAQCRKDHLKYDNYPVKCDNTWKEFIRKIGIINVSKYLNAMAQISTSKTFGSKSHTLISWHNNGKKRKLEVENNYVFSKDTIKVYSSITWDIEGNIIDKFCDADR